MFILSCNLPVGCSFLLPFPLFLSLLFYPLSLSSLYTAAGPDAAGPAATERKREGEGETGGRGEEREGKRKRKKRDPHAHPHKKRRKPPCWSRRITLTLFCGPSLLRFYS